MSNKSGLNTQKAAKGDDLIPKKQSEISQKIREAAENIRKQA